jgi:hypothetical protein
MNPDKPEGYTALGYAVNGRQWEVAAYLLDHGASATASFPSSAQDFSGWHASLPLIWIALTQGGEEGIPIAHKLAEKGAAIKKDVVVDLSKTLGVTVTLPAATLAAYAPPLPEDMVRWTAEDMQRNPKLVLSESFAKSAYSPLWHLSPINLAILKHKEDLFKAYFAAGSSWAVPDGSGLTPLIAMLYGFRLSSVPPEYRQQIGEASKVKGNVYLAENFGSGGNFLALTKAQRAASDTLPIFQTRLGPESLLGDLLDAGADPNQALGDKLPLIEAARSQDPSTAYNQVRILIEHGAKADILVPGTKLSLVEYLADRTFSEKVRGSDYGIRSLLALVPIYDRSLSAYVPKTIAVHIEDTPIVSSRGAYIER